MPRLDFPFRPFELPPVQPASEKLGARSGKIDEGCNFVSYSLRKIISTRARNTNGHEFI